MSGGNPIALPPQWETDGIGKKSASFVNDERGLTVTIRAVFKGSRGSTRGNEPTHYVVQLRQDWFSRGVLGDRNMAAKVSTREEAFDVAQEFMEEFTREIEAVSREEVEATHRATGDDHEAAEQILTTEAAAEALADAAGYSDDLLVSVLAAETNDQYRFVAHRDGDSVTTVAGDESALGEDTSIRTLHAVFPIDDAGIQRVLSEETPITTVVHLGDSTVYRFIFGETRETDVVLPRGTQVTSPGFETAIANVLEEKWERDN